MNTQEMLLAFHSALGENMGRGGAELRKTLHEEENKELIDELDFDDVFIMREPLARELADVVYVCYGTAHAFGINLDEAIKEVHRAAMSKIDPAVRVTREDGKILKPKGFIPPNMSRAIYPQEI